MNDTKLKLIGGDMSLKFNRSLTDKEQKKLVKTYNAVGWQFYFTNEDFTEIAFQRLNPVNADLPKHEDD